MVHIECCHEIGPVAGLRFLEAALPVVQLCGT